MAGEWIDTGVLPSTSGPGFAVAMGAHIFYSGSQSTPSLFRTDGVSAAVQVAAGLASMSLQELFVFNNELYSLWYNSTTSPTLRMYRWDGVSAWVLAASVGGITQLFPTCVGIYNNNIFVGARRLTSSPNFYLFEWNGGSGFDTRASLNLTEARPCSMAVHGGALYIGTQAFGGEATSNANCGVLYSYTTPGTLAVAAPKSSTIRSSVASLHSIGGSLYTLGRLGELIRYNGTSAWEAADVLSPLPADDSFTSFNNDRSALVSGGVLYAGMNSARGPSTGLLWSWDGAAASWTLESEPNPAPYTIDPGSACNCLLEFDGEIYGILNNITFPVLCLFETEAPPTQSRLLPNSTAAISHARILREHRSPLRAQAFHDIMRVHG